MVYHRNWEDFAKEAKKLYEASPAKVRYCTRWRHRDGLLVLKITDDVQYRTRSSIILNRFDQLNRVLMAGMQHRPLPAPTLPLLAAPASPAPGSPALQAASAPSSKSKKKGKRK